jgi:hypothetical protein
VRHAATPRTAGRVRIARYSIAFVEICGETLGRYAALKGSFTHGANSFKFTGRLGKKKLKPGSYRLAATATDAAGNKSAKKYAKFRVVKR